MDNDAYLDLLKRCLAGSIYEESAWTIVEGPMPGRRGPLAALKRRAVAALRARGLALVRMRPYDAALRAEGLDWPLVGMTMVGEARLDNIRHCVEAVVADGVPGDFVETGVWRGGSAIYAAAVLRSLGAIERRVWCCDSFEGMPTPDSKDLAIDADSDFSDRSYLRVDEHQVARNFDRFGLLDDNVRFVKGWFSDSLPTAPIDRIGVLRLDGDLYASTMDSLTALYPRLSPRGFVIVDDYHSWAGCRQAADEFRARHGITAPLQRIDAHAVFWRQG